MYPPQGIHDLVSQYEDVVFAIVCSFWMYEWIEERIKKHMKNKRKTRRSMKGGKR